MPINSLNCVIKVKPKRLKLITNFHQIDIKITMKQTMLQLKNSSICEHLFIQFSNIANESKPTNQASE